MTAAFGMCSMHRLPHLRLAERIVAFRLGIRANG